MSIFNKILVKAGLRVEVTLVDKPFPKVEMDDINALNAHLNAVLAKAAEPNVKFSEVVKVMTAEAPVVELAKEVQAADAGFPASEAVEPAAQAAAEEPAEIKTVRAHIRPVTGGESYGPVRAEPGLGKSLVEQADAAATVAAEGIADLALRSRNVDVADVVMPAGHEALEYLVEETQKVQEDIDYLINAGVPGVQAALAIRHRNPAESLDAIVARLTPKSEVKPTFVEQLRENSIERSEQAEEAQDDYQNLPDFWAVFARRLSGRGVLMVNSDKDLLDKKPKLQKGYHLVRLTNTNEAGIVHVSKAALAALFPMANGEYRVVASKRTIHLNGADTVGADVAKLFLNGRY